MNSILQPSSLPAKPLIPDETLEKCCRKISYGKQHKELEAHVVFSGINTDCLHRNGRDQ